MYKTYATGDLDVNDGTSFLNFYPVNTPEGEMRKSDALAVNIIHNETPQQDFRWIALDLPLIHIDDVDNASQGCCACSTCGAEAVKLALIPGTEFLIDVNLFAELGGDWGALFTSSQNQTDKGPSFNTGDIPADATTTTSISIGGSISSSLEVLGDHDWIEFTITAADIANGTIFEFNLFGSGSDPLEDPLLEIRNSDGVVIGSNDDIQLGVILNSRLIIELDTPGTYYLDVQAWNNSEDGDYTLTADYRAPLPTYTLDQVADYLTGGSWTPRTHDDFDNNASNGTTIRYYIGDLPAATQALALAAMESWAAVANLNFIAATSAAASDIRFEDNDPDGGAFAATTSTNGGTTISSVRINVDAGWNRGNTDINSYTYQTYIHEIGHALGLGHGGPYNGNATYNIDNIYTNDSWGITVMSYFDQAEAGSGTFRLVLAPQLADILAIQNLYGANMTYRNGDTVYGFNASADVAGSVFDAANWQAQGIKMPSVSIWDTGGNDTLDFSGYSANQRISLIAETWSDVGDNTNTSDTTDPLYNLISIARGAIIENAIGGSGNDTITGNAASNVLTGNGGNDILDGGAGVDYAAYSGTVAAYMVTDNGDGTFTVSHNNGGSNGTDTLSNIEFLRFSDGDVEISSVAGSNNLTSNDDVWSGTSGDDLINGLNGDDTLYGLAGNDTLNGGGGNDNLFGGLGADILNGGAGVDRVFYSLASSGVTANFIDQSLNTGEAAGDTYISIEAINGSQFNDFITSGNDNNDLIGLGGDDILVGAGGDDRLFGGDGNDRLLGGANNDDLFGQGGADTFVIRAGAGIDRIFDFVSGQDKIEFEGGPNQISQLIIEQVGADTHITSFNGVTVLIGVTASTLSASDFVFINPLPNPTGVSVTTNLTQGVDVFTGDANNNTINGLGGDDTIHGGIGDDILNGGDGNDTLYGGLGADTLNGGDGVDRVFYANAATGVTANFIDQTLNTGEAAGDVYISIESITGSQYDDFITSGNDDNDLIGLAGNDILVGAGGADRLFGGDGNDRLLGGTGNDDLFGQGGADVFVIRAGGGDDRIFDFEQGVDLIEYEGGPGSFSALTFTQDGNNVLIASSNGNTYVLNALVADFSASDFIFSNPASAEDLDTDKLGVLFASTNHEQTEDKAPLPLVSEDMTPDFIDLDYFATAEFLSANAHINDAYWDKVFNSNYDVELLFDVRSDFVFPDAFDV